MLEKAPWKIDERKLRAMLLLEADYNVMHKIIFNGKLMTTLERKNHIPFEIIDVGRNQAAKKRGI